MVVLAELDRPIDSGEDLGVSLGIQKSLTWLQYFELTSVDYKRVS